MRIHFNKSRLSVLRWIGCFMLFAALGIQTSSAQVSTTVTMSASPIAGSPFSSLAAAIAAVNGMAITGPVVVTASAGSETNPAGGYSITATGTSTNTIIVQGASPGTTTITSPSPAGTVGALNDAIFKIIGGDYVTIQNFTMNENSSNTTTTAASNNMVEWGVALLYASTTNGAQNCIIQNNTITLNRTYQNTFGIYSNSTHSATAPTTSATATGSGGGNSGLKIYGNTISNVNIGMVVIGPTAAADANTGIDIGGTGGVQANTISNFGTTGTFSGYANVSGTVNGILVRNSNGINVSYNSITSSAGGTTAGALNGIQLGGASATPTTTFTNAITNNTISLQSGVTAGAINGITCPSGSASATSVLNVNNNNFTQLNHSVSASGTIICIGIACTNLTTSISNNTFTNLTTNTTGNFTFISQTFTAPANGSKTTNGNSIVTAFSKTGGGGTVLFITDNGSTTLTCTSNCQNNNFSNGTLTGATTLTGLNYTDGGTAPARTVSGNIISNWTAGTSAVNCMNFTYWSNVSSLTNNTVSNISGQAAITGITIGSTVNTATSVSIANNIISNLTSTGAGGAVIGIACSNTSPLININNNSISTLSSTGASAVSGISITGATATNVYKNTICNLQGSNASSTVNGIIVSTGTTVTIHNNRIGDLRAPSANAANPLVGINITGGTSVSAYYNTVYLNGSSTGANFGSSAISASTTPTLTLNNNSFHNASSNNGTGLAVAYRRSTTTLTSYTSSSDRNNFLASTIFYDGTTAVTGIAAYKSLMATRDQNAMSVLPPYLSSTCGDVNFLKMNLTTPTQIESGGAPIAGITDDFEGDLRDASTPDIGADEFSGTPAPVCAGTPATPNITGSASVCSGFGTSLGLSILYTDLGITYQWASSSAQGGPYTNLSTGAAQSTGVLTTPMYYVCTITCTTSGLSTTTAEFMVDVNALPIVSATSTSPVYCNPGTGVGLTASGANAYTWTPTTGLAPATGANVTAAPTTSLVYTVTGTDDNGCTATSTVSLNVAPAVTGVTATASSTTICNGASIDLSSTSNAPTTPSVSIFTEGFETGASGWVFSDSSSTGTNLAQQIWHIQASPYTDPTGSITFSNFSVSGSNFAYANADAGGSGSQTRTFMTSPTFSTVGYTGNATLSFKMVYKFWSSSSPAEQVYVQISGDGGSTWNTLKDYSPTNAGPDVGTTTNNAQVAATSSITIPSSYMGNPNCKLRWRYVSNWGFVWIVDDINLLGSPVYNYSWNSTPSGFSSNTQNPTGVAPTVSTDYQVTVSGAGCSGSSVVSVTVNQPTTGTTNATACDSYIWPAPLGDGQTYTASNSSATNISTNAAGCPHTETLNLTVNYSNTGSSSHTACDMAIIDGVTYTQSGSHTHTYTNASGCDSVHTYNVTIRYSNTGSISTTACNSAEVDGVTYTQSGSHTHTYTNVDGCDSVHTYHVTIHYSNAGSSNHTACDLTSVDGVSYTQSGSHTHTYTNIDGCDSIHTYNVTINYSNTGSSSTTACNSAEVDGVTYTQSGSHTHSYTNVAGCDSVHTYNVTINYSNTGSSNHSGCDMAVVDNVTYTQSGSHTHTYTNVDGCDSVHTYQVTIHYSNTGSSNHTACDMTVVDNVAYTQSGSHTHTYTNVDGCDSVHTYHVTIDYSTTGTTSATACDTYTWSGPLGNGNTYTTSNQSATHVSTNSAGCPHTESLNLTINYSTSGTTTATSCDSYTWSGPLGNGNTYTSSNTSDTYVTTNAAGCSHTQSLNLTINYSTSSSVNVTACDTYTWSCNGETYNQSGTYTCMGTNAAGCTHTTTLNLTINYSTSATTTVQEACGSYVWSVNGQTYTQSGTYTVMSTNAAGCPHASILNLTVIPSVPTTVSQTQCGGTYTWACTGNTYSQSGTYTCGSGCYQVTLNLTINTIPTVTAGNVSGCPGSAITLIGSPSGGTYSLPNPYTGTATSYTYFYTSPQGCTNSAVGTITYSTNVGNVNNLTVSGITSTSAIASWGGNGVWFDIRYKTLTSAVWTNAASSAALNKQITGLAALTTYTLEVRGYCEKTGIPTAWTGTTFTTTGGSSCATPTPTTTTNITKSAAKLNWTHPGASYYSVRYKKASVSTWTSVGTTTPNYKLLSGLSANTQYEFQVQAVCSNTYTSAWSASGFFTTLASKLGEEETPEISMNYTIYPNPTKDELNIDYAVDHNTAVVLKVVDMSGRTVKLLQTDAAQGMNSIRISLGDLANGIYTLQVIGDDQVLYTTRVSKN